MSPLPSEHMDQLFHTLAYCFISIYQTDERLGRILYVKHFTSSKAIRFIQFFSLFNQSYKILKGRDGK